MQRLLGTRSDKSHRTLWERLESGGKDRRRKVLILVGAIAVTLVALWFLDRSLPIDLSPLLMALSIAMLVLLFGPGVLRGENQTDARMLRAQRVPAGTMPGLEGALADMAIAAGLQPPDLYWVDVDSANACVLDDGSVCITRGLIQLLTIDECRAIFAWLVGRMSEPDLVGSFVGAFASEGAEVTDAEALRLVRDPGAMLRAWTKVLQSRNRVPGWLWVSAARFLVPRGQTSAWRERRLVQLTELAGAMSVNTTNGGR